MLKHRSSMFMQNQFTFSTLWNPLGSHSKVTLVPEKRWEKKFQQIARSKRLTHIVRLKKLTWTDLVWRTWRTPSSPSSMMEPWSPPRRTDSQGTGDQDKPQISSQYIPICPNSKGHADGWCRNGHHWMLLLWHWHSRQTTIHKLCEFTAFLFYDTMIPL